MASNTLYVRSQQKSDTSQNWNLATNFIPFLGEIIYYTDLNMLKIGDGNTSVVNLPFLKVRVEDLNLATLKIGTYSYNGTQDVNIPVYDGT